MKNKLLYLLVLGISSISFGQTLENSYTSYGINDEIGNYAFFTESSLFYLTINTNSNEVSIYNSNHTLYKTANLTIPANYTFVRLYFATDKLFNLDPEIEILIGLSNNSTSEVKMLLFNEDGGDHLFDFGDKADVKIFKDNNTYKMITEREIFTTEVISNYDVYALPGTLTLSQETLLNRQGIAFFPNPSSNRINITNPFKNNEKEKIAVYDMSGKKVLEKEILGNGKNIELDISDLSKGIYIFKINESGNKFIKN